MSPTLLPRLDLDAATYSDEDRATALEPWTKPTPDHIPGSRTRVSPPGNGDLDEPAFAAGLERLARVEAGH